MTQSRDSANHFTELEDGRIRWVIETEFRFKGIVWLISKMAPGMFKKQTQSGMDVFKAFAEG